MPYILDYTQDGTTKKFETTDYRTYFSTYWQLMADRSVTWMKKPKKIPKLA